MNIELVAEKFTVPSLLLNSILEKNEVSRGGVRRGLLFGQCNPTIGERGRGH